jgi:hypothetical protein
LKIDVRDCSDLYGVFYHRYLGEVTGFVAVTRQRQANTKVSIRAASTLCSVLDVYFLVSNAEGVEQV